MEVEKIGEIVYDGKMLNLDEISLESCNTILNEISVQKQTTIDMINEILAEIQNGKVNNYGKRS